MGIVDVYLDEDIEHKVSINALDQNNRISVSTITNLCLPATNPQSNSKNLSPLIGSFPLCSTEHQHAQSNEPFLKEL